MKPDLVSRGEFERFRSDCEKAGVHLVFISIASSESPPGIIYDTVDDAFKRVGGYPVMMAYFDNTWIFAGLTSETIDKGGSDEGQVDTERVS